MSPSNPSRSTWWSRNEIVAWIAFRKLDAVATVSQMERQGARQPLLALTADAALVRAYAKPGTWLDRESEVSSGTLLRRASDEWSQTSSSFEVRVDGRVRRKEIQRRWPPHRPEGRGKGQAKRAHFNPVDVALLVERLIFTRRDMTRNEIRDDLFGAKYRKEIVPLFATANQLAHRRIVTGQSRWQSEDAATDANDLDLLEKFSPDEAARCRENLASWSRPESDRSAALSRLNEQSLAAARWNSDRRQAAIDEMEKKIKAEKPDDTDE